ncbi:MAG TPA: anhydro-N-acetylmuramic acid kinase [Gammaproteobacteria bacterium]|jgi:anhydro-N-acetylmuramic acid kinase|nr:anhydro-N-acetylmuramic acid kinase [Gammaproteobacteria bacterium]
MSDLYIGLMSGTSVDGIDAALVDLTEARPKLIASHYAPYTPELRAKILALCTIGDNEIQRLGELDVLLGQAFADAVQTLLTSQAFSTQTITAIGSHGQSIRHHPHAPYCFTLQIGDPNIIAAKTGIPTIADFRRKDVALGGQGAPLVPAFHQHVFKSETVDRVIVNIGGIANVTILPKNGLVTGFDTGPGNTLLDTWIEKHTNNTHDKAGAWSQQGKVHTILLNNLFSDAYFQLPAPKSTGREYFNLTWLQTYLTALPAIAAVDVQATLVELTAISILQAVQRYFVAGEILICGGGVHNIALMTRLQQLAAPDFITASTANYGLDPDWVEAIAFAWLARQTWHQLPGNLPSVTGAKEKAVLGAIYY